VAHVVLHHHEGFDGNGYPNRLSGEQIPPMRASSPSPTAIRRLWPTVRPYHKPRTHAEIMKLMFDQQSGKYDPYFELLFAGVAEHSPYRAAAG
jgi:HD-GYP domain-containing protein (c-di-GMP phosphodiesterase class II)